MPAPPRPATPPGALHAFYEASTDAGERERLDQGSWDDLDLQAVFEHIDRSVSLPGRLALYRMLRTPTASAAVLDERERLVCALAPGGAAGEALASELGRLERTAAVEDVVSLLWSPPEAPPPSWLPALMGIAAVASLAAALLVGKALVFAPFVAFGANFALHSRTRLRWLGELQALRFLARMMGVARKVAALQRLEGLAEPQARLAAAVCRTAPLVRQVAWLSSGAAWGVLYDYVNVFLLLEVRAYARIVARLREHLPALREALLLLGELDALRGVAAWRAELGRWCRPRLEDDGPGRLLAEEATHPLLAAAIPNSIEVRARGALVTGANMSGKSTFLRVLGINAVLAQSIGTCCARRFEASRLRVLCSMRAQDDVLRGRSRYLVEAERLRTLVQQARGDRPALCLIDELLSGTNAAERLAASAAILEHLQQQGALVVAATHDLELAGQLERSFDTYNFADDFAADDVRFDHRIRVGPARSRNAIELLARVGYPQELVARARARLDGS